MNKPNVAMKSLATGTVSHWNSYADAQAYWRSMNSVQAGQHHRSHHADMEIWRSMDGKADAVEVSWK